VRSSAAFDDEEVGIDLIGSVNGQVEARMLVQRGQSDAGGNGQILGLKGGGNAREIQTLLFDPVA
jgi:hypothetical protein